MIIPRRVRNAIEVLFNRVPKFPPTLPGHVLHYRIGCDNGEDILIDFGEWVYWFRIKPDDAVRFAQYILDEAQKLSTASKED